MANQKLQQKLGILDFFDYVYECNPEYALIAVKAPLEITVNSFLKLSETTTTKKHLNSSKQNQKKTKSPKRKITWEKNIPLKSEYGYGFLVKAIPFLQIHDNQWTVILRSLFYLNLEQSDDIPTEAKKLSATLATKTITLIGDDIAEIGEDYNHRIGYDFFEKGEILEGFEKSDEDRVYFESTLREKPNLDFDKHQVGAYDITKEPRVKFINEFFRELGIYLPGCYPGRREEENQIGLVIKKASENTIERADWLIRKPV